MAEGDRDAPSGAGEEGESASERAPGGQVAARFPDSAVLAHIRDAVVVIDNNHRILYWGPGAAALFGTPAAEALGRPIEEIYRWRWLDPADERAAYAALDRDGFWRGETLHLPRSGEERHVESSVSVIRGEGGARIGLLAVIRDETDRHRMEAALRESEARFRSLAENAPDLVARFDRRHRHLYINQAGARAAGKDPGQILGKTPASSGSRTTSRRTWRSASSASSAPASRTSWSSASPARAALGSSSPGWCRSGARAALWRPCSSSRAT